MSLSSHKNIIFSPKGKILQEGSSCWTYWITPTGHAWTSTSRKTTCGYLLLSVLNTGAILIQGWHLEGKRKHGRGLRQSCSGFTALVLEMYHLQTLKLIQHFWFYGDAKCHTHSLFKMYTTYIHSMEWLYCLKWSILLYDMKKVLHYHMHLMHIRYFQPRTGKSALVSYQLPGQPDYVFT